ncbi:MAG TPA: ABC transporter ATP-binding protein [Acidimicrobiia bacterium]|nr:ABC transporter ATP-binding protein [Acidimicrobiia bacterium]
MTVALEITGLHVTLDGHPVLRGLDLTVAPREVMALLGPSGSGKTTLLSTVAGFVEPAGGTIVVGGRTVSGAGIHEPPEARDLGFVFQSYALWPHLSALDTVAFPIEAGGGSRPEARRRAKRVLDALGIGELADRRPADLSGGQQQRVGLARALARAASLFLLDEPTAHLDGPTRGAAEALIARQRREAGSAAVYATHDPGEAFAVADRVALLRDGAVVQVGAPEAVYAHPVDAWAARLTGPVSVVEVHQRAGAVVVGEAEMPADGAGDGPATVAIRPEWVRLGGPAPGVVQATRFRGPHTDVTLDTPVGEVEVRVAGRPAPRAGERVGWTVDRVHRLGRPPPGQALP